MPRLNEGFGPGAKKIAKRRRDEHALKNVVSLRISDEEMVVLEKISRSSEKSISEIMREAYKSWQANRLRPCPDI